jgi:uncharacterized protein YkwD
MKHHCNSHSLIKAVLAVAIIILTLSLVACTASEATPLPPSASPTVNASSAPTSTPPKSVPSPNSSLPPKTTPTPTSTTMPTATPTPVYTPPATPFNPSPAQMDLINFVLGLINKDRQVSGSGPVELSFNAAAQQHAQDMLDNKYIAHWDTDGLKPYMRYTLSGGLNYEGENSAGYSTSAPIFDIKIQLQNFEKDMMAESPPNDSHRKNILNKWNKKVSIGIAYNNHGVYLVQQFEGDYLEYYQPPAIINNILSLSGRFTQPGIVLNNIAITYDDLPQKLTGQQLTEGPYHVYGPGKTLGQIFPPAPPGSNYKTLPPNSVIGTKGSFDQSGEFSIQADISNFLTQGKGVYTIALIATSGIEVKNFTNYSIFIQ